MKSIVPSVRSFILPIFIIILSSSAKASLLGTELCGQFNLGNSVTNLFNPDGDPEKTCKNVTANTEFSINLPGVHFDFDSDSMSISFDANQSFINWGVIFTELDWGDIKGEITDVRLEGSNGFDIAETPQVNIVAGSGFVITGGAASIGDLGAFARFKIETKHVSEPTSLALLIFGLAGVGYLRKRI